MPQKCLNTSRSQKGWCNKPIELQFQSIYNAVNSYALQRYKSTEVDCRTWQNVSSGTPWSTSSDTHKVVEI